MKLAAHGETAAQDNRRGGPGRRGPRFDRRRELRRLEERWFQIPPALSRCCGRRAALTAAILGLAACAFLVWRARRESRRTWEEVPPAGPGKIYLVERVPFAVWIDGLVGTVKGETIELTFGGQEEKLVAARVRVGDSVRAGQTLFELDHLRAAARKQQAEIAWRRTEDLFAVGAAALQDVQEARAAYAIARRDCDDTFIAAPKRGSVSEIRKREGEMVSRHETVAVLVSAQDPLYVETGVAEGRIDEVRPGQEAEVEVEASGLSRLPGRVMGVSREVTAGGRTGAVIVALPASAQDRLRPGLTARLRIRTASAERLVIPRSAFDPDRGGVYAIGADGKVAFLPVSIGRASGEYVEVASGLEVGEKIVVDPWSAPWRENEVAAEIGEVLRYRPPE